MNKRGVALVLVVAIATAFLGIARAGLCQDDVPALAPAGASVLRSDCVQSKVSDDGTLTLFLALGSPQLEESPVKRLTLFCPKERPQEMMYRGSSVEVEYSRLFAPVWTRDEAKAALATIRKETKSSIDLAIKTYLESGGRDQQWLESQVMAIFEALLKKDLEQAIKKAAEDAVHSAVAEEVKKQLAKPAKAPLARPAAVKPVPQEPGQ